MTQAEIEKAANDYASRSEGQWKDRTPVAHELVDAYLAGAEHAGAKWTRTKDELPRDGEIVLIPFQTYSMPAEYNVVKGGEAYWLLWDFPGSTSPERVLHFVTQWMRLPAAPEAESK